MGSPLRALFTPLRPARPSQTAPRVLARRQRLFEQVVAQVPVLHLQPRVVGSAGVASPAAAMLGGIRGVEGAVAEGAAEGEGRRGPQGRELGQEARPGVAAAGAQQEVGEGAGEGLHLGRAAPAGVVPGRGQAVLAGGQGPRLCQGDQGGVEHAGLCRGTGTGPKKAQETRGKGARQRRAVTVPGGLEEGRKDADGGVCLGGRRGVDHQPPGGAGHHGAGPPRGVDVGRGPCGCLRLAGNAPREEHGHAEVRLAKGVVGAVDAACDAQGAAQLVRARESRHNCPRNAAWGGGEARLPWHQEEVRVRSAGPGTLLPGLGCGHLGVHEVRKVGRHLRLAHGQLSKDPGGRGSGAASRETALADARAAIANKTVAGRQSRGPRSRAHQW